MSLVDDIKYLGSDLRKTLLRRPPQNWLEDSIKGLRRQSDMENDDEEDIGGKEEPPEFDMIFVFHMPSTADTVANRDGTLEPDPKCMDSKAMRKVLGIKSPGCWSKFRGRVQEENWNEAVRSEILGSARTGLALSAMGSFLDWSLQGQQIKTARQVRQIVLDMFLELLHPDTFKVQTFSSVDRDEVFVCVSARDGAMLQHATFYEYRFQLDRKVMDKTFDLGYLPPGSSLAHVAYQQCLTPFLRTWGIPGTRKSSIFRTVDRIRLCRDILYGQVDFSSWVDLGVLIKHFPTHNRILVQRLSWTWGHPRSWKFRCKYARDAAEAVGKKAELMARNKQEPSCYGKSKVRAARNAAARKEWYRIVGPDKRLNEVRDYFGERIAFYFAFLWHTIKFLMILSVFAIAVTVREVMKFDWRDIALGNKWDEQARIAFGCITAIWSAVFVQTWRRREAILANRWGTESQNITTTWILKHDSKKNRNLLRQKLQSKDDTASSHARKSHLKKPLSVASLSIAHSRSEENSQTQARQCGRIFSWFVTTLFVALVCCTTALIMWLRSQLVSENQPIAARLTSLLLSLQTQVYINLWPYAASWLTNLEYQFLERDFICSHAIKVFLVDFFTGFAANFYTGFFQEFLETKVGDQKAYYMTVLVIDMEVIFGIYIFCTLLDILLPFVSLKCRLMSEARKMKSLIGCTHEVSYLESQAKYDEYSGEYETYDYEQIIFPLAFVMLFGITMPLAVFLALLTVFAQLKADAWKLANVYQRPYPMYADGISKWRVSLLALLSVMSAFVNLGLIIFRLKDEKGIDGMKRQEMYTFFKGEHALIAAIVLIQVAIPSVPRFVVAEKQRQDWQQHQVRSKMANVSLKLGRGQTRAQTMTTPPPSETFNANQPRSPTESFCEETNPAKDSGEAAVHNHRSYTDFDNVVGLGPEHPYYEHALI